jgi:small subunit ribosomal protein S21
MAMSFLPFICGANPFAPALGHDIGLASPKGIPPGHVVLRVSRPNPGALTITETGEGGQVQVLVRDNNVDQALKALKKKMQREGIFREMKLRGHYEKPSEKRARQKAEAVRRARKMARKRMQREGLIAAPKKPVR